MQRESTEGSSDTASDFYVANGEEIGNSWNVLDSYDDHPAGWYGLAPGYGLYPGPAWFDQNGIDMALNIALEVEQRLRDEHNTQRMMTQHYSERRKPWSPKKFHLIAQGIAVGIKIGLHIAQQRAERSTDLVPRQPS